MKCQELPKESTGSVPSEKPTLRPLDLSATESNTSVDSLKKEKEDSDIGSFYLSWLQSREEPGSPLAYKDTGNSRDQMLPTNMSGKKTPESKAPNLKWEKEKPKETLKPTGKRSSNWPSEEELTKCQVTYTFAVITSYEELAKTMHYLLLWSAPVLFFGARLRLGSHIEHGRKPVWTLSLKIQRLNGGMDIQIRNMLSLMNFEVNFINSRNY